MVNVLLLHSVDDDSAQSRIRAIEARPGLEDYRFHHLFIFTPEDGEAMMREPSLKPSELLERNQEAIFGRLADWIGNFKPDLFLLHTGVAFTVAPDVILSVVSRLRRQFPALNFGIQEGFAFRQTVNAEGPSFAYRIDQMFTRSPELTDLMAKLF